jgi:hypothetical protein
MRKSIQEGMKFAPAMPEVATIRIRQESPMLSPPKKSPKFKRVSKF